MLTELLGVLEACDMVEKLCVSLHTWLILAVSAEVSYFPL